MRNEHTMLTEALRDLIDDGHTTVQEVCEATGYGKTAVYDWRSGTSQMPAAAIQGLIRRHSNPIVQRRILDEFLGGHAVLVEKFTEAEMDANHDGRVDLDDTLIQALNANSESAKFLLGLQSKIADGALTDSEYRELAGHRAAVERAWELVAACGKRCVQTGPVRRKAKVTS